MLDLADQLAAHQILAMKKNRYSPYQNKKEQWLFKLEKLREEVETTGRVSTKNEYYRWLHNELRQIRKIDTEETRWKSKMLLSIGIDYTVY